MVSVCKRVLWERRTAWYGDILGHVDGTGAAKRPLGSGDTCLGRSFSRLAPCQGVGLLFGDFRGRGPLVGWEGNSLLSL